MPSFAVLWPNDATCFRRVHELAKIQRRQTKAIGMNAVETMAQQLGGDLEIEMDGSRRAVTFILKMPNSQLTALSVQQAARQRKAS